MNTQVPGFDVAAKRAEFESMSNYMLSRWDSYTRDTDNASSDEHRWMGKYIDSLNKCRGWTGKPELDHDELSEHLLSEYEIAATAGIDEWDQPRVTAMVTFLVTIDTCSGGLGGPTSGILSSAP